MASHTSWATDGRESIHSGGSLATAERNAAPQTESRSSGAVPPESRRAELHGGGECAPPEQPDGDREDPDKAEDDA